MFQIGTARLRYTVIVVVDDVIQHTHGNVDGVLQFFLVEPVFVHVLRQVDGTEVADGNLVIRGVQRDLGTQVG